MARRPATRRPATKPNHVRSDGWENVFTGLGGARDKRSGGRVTIGSLGFNQAEALYQGDDMAARIIEDPPSEMIRKGFDVLVAEEREVAEAVEARLDELEALDKLQQALTWERAYGGAAIILGAEDGAFDQSQPLREDGLRALRWLQVVHAHELTPRSYYGDPRDGAKFGEPEVWTLSASSPGGKAVTAQVHETRIIRFTGIQTSRNHAIQRQGWGDPVMVRVLQVLSDFGQLWGGAAALMQDFSQAIFRIRGLAELIASGREDVVRKRLEAIDMARGIVRAAILDAGDAEQGVAGEEFERKATPLSGYPEMLQQFSLRLAAAADMPVSRLMGQAPAGLNATGQADVIWWTERIEGLQGKKLRRPLNRLVKLVLRSKEGPTQGKEPGNWSVRFRPLRQLTAGEEADRRLKIAQADAAYVQAGILSAEEVAVSRFSGDGFGEDIAIDLELRRRMAEEQPGEGEAAEQLAEGAKQGAPPAGAGEDEEDEAE